MPSQKLPQKDQITWLSGELIPRKFETVCGLEHFRRTTKDEAAIPPTPRNGGELGYIYQKGNLTECVWTGWVPGAGSRIKDRCWIILEQDGELVYALSIYRTGDCVGRLAMEAKIMRRRIQLRPRCQQCGEAMNVVRGKGLGSHYWKCPAEHSRASWDTKEFWDSLPEDAKQHLIRRRRAHRRWLDRCRKMGKKINAAILIKKPWKRAPLPIGEF